MSFIKTNKLIAEFEGHQINYGFNKTGVLFLGQHINEDKLLYHSSWNWLIPVIIKIKEIEVAKGIDNVGLSQQLNPYTYDKDRLYKSVVEYVKSYNYKNKRKK